MTNNDPISFFNYLINVNPRMEYVPTDFDWVNYKISAEKLVQHLSNQFQIDFTLAPWGTIQDATFSVSLPIPQKLLKNTSLARPSIRISNFDKLITITNEHKVAKDALELLVKVILAHEFTYIPAELFGESFDTRARVNGDLFNQLFDYV